MGTPPDDLDRYRVLARRLHDVAAPMRVLAALRWPSDVRETFIAGGAQRLPEVTYADFDATPIIDEVRSIRRMIYPGGLVDDWFESQVTAVDIAPSAVAAGGSATRGENTTTDR